MRSRLLRTALLVIPLAVPAIAGCAVPGHGATARPGTPAPSVGVTMPAAPTSGRPPAGVATSPPVRPVVPPAGAPEPATSPLPRAAAVGAGANPRVAPIPDPVWAAMQGRTWRPGCVPRTRLRHLTVNYWGFDGYRYRGELVVASSVAADVAAILTDLYALHYPIRQMVLPDAFGANPKGIGADDFAQMAADNTSAFNCRYVVGREAQHVLSLHAGGRAIDINTWENPYVAPDGRYPDTWYLVHRNAAGPAVLTAGGPAVRAFTRRGWTWGGTWAQKDWQHFQR